MQLIVQGGTSLVAAQIDATAWSKADIVVTGDRIKSVNFLPSSVSSFAGYRLDASDLLVLPGAVDIHGDAFERQIQPRPDTTFEYDIAMAETDRQLVTNGITTACHGLTYSWEGGLRGRDAAFALINEIALQRRTALADHRIHLRFESHHIDGLQDVLNWIQQDQIDFLAFNEHLPSIAAKSSRPEKLAAYAERARCTIDNFLQRMREAQGRSAEVPPTIKAIAAACQEYDVPMASHDDETVSDRERFHDLGVHVSEFPRSLDALGSALAYRNKVIMGAPNVLLGGSHCGGLNAADAIKQGMCDILASDYYYPSLLHAPFQLAHRGICSLEDAWNLVSLNPATVLGLADRGRIASGCRADLIAVKPGAQGRVRLIATIAAGKLAYCAEPERLVSHSLYSAAA